MAAQQSGGGSRRSNSWTIGGIIDDRYELRQLLATGEYSEVYAAVQLNSEDRVAIKCLRADLVDLAELVARMKKEAKLLTRLKHPNIVRLLDAAVAGGRPFLAMELLEGQDLRQLVAHEGALPLPRALFIVMHAALAIEAAHDVGIIHRDLKPANIFLTFANEIKVLDFGAAKFHYGARSVDDARRIGTLPYMAPEVLRGAPASERSDIFALGVILFELLRGRHFFALSRTRWPEEPELYRLMSEWRFPPLEKLLPDVSDHLRDAIQQAIASEPDDRFATAEEFRLALDGALHLYLCENLPREASEHPSSETGELGLAKGQSANEPSGPRPSFSSSTHVPVAAVARAGAGHDSEPDEIVAPAPVSLNLVPVNRLKNEADPALAPTVEVAAVRPAVFPRAGDSRSASTTPYVSPVRVGRTILEAKAPAAPTVPPPAFARGQRSEEPIEASSAIPTAHSRRGLNSERSVPERRRQDSKPIRNKDAPVAIRAQTKPGRNAPTRPSPAQPEPWSTRFELLRTREVVRWLAVLLSAVIGVLLVLAVAFAVTFTRHPVSTTAAPTSSVVMELPSASSPAIGVQPAEEPAVAQAMPHPSGSTLAEPMPTTSASAVTSASATVPPPRLRPRARPVAPKRDEDWLPKAVF